MIILIKYPTLKPQIKKRPLKKVFVNYCLILIYLQKKEKTRRAYMKHRTKLYNAIIYPMMFFDNRMIKEWVYVFRQKNKQFYNYTLYMCIWPFNFNKQTLDNYMYNTTHITNDIYNGNIPFLLFGWCYLHITYKVYYELSKTYIIL